MTKSDEKKDAKPLSEDKNDVQKDGLKKNEHISVKEETVEDKLKIIEEKLLRTMAEMENQEEDLKKKDKKPLNLEDLILRENHCLS